VFHEALDRPALAGGVTALEQDDEPFARYLHPRLELQQLDLQQTFVALVVAAVEPLVVGVALAPGVHDLTVGAQQYRVIVAGALVHPVRRQVIHGGSLGTQRDQLS
jgi:hypothetical protein